MLFLALTRLWLHSQTCLSRSHANRVLLTNEAFRVLGLPTA